MPPRKHKLDLLENGLDYILSGVDHLIEDKGRSHKYAILHLAAGVELVLKHVIQKEHWSLLFEDAKKANRGALESGDFNSINFDSILYRLKNVCGIDLSKDDEIDLDNLRKLRNKIQHFRVDINIISARILCSRILLFLHPFIEEYCEIETLSASAQEVWSGIRERSMKIMELVTAKFEKLKPLLMKEAKKSSVFLCPSCRKDAFIVNNSICLLCDYHDTPDEVANLYAENILGESANECAMSGGDFPVTNCPECDQLNTLVITDEGTLCYNCGDEEDITNISYCIRCGELMRKNDDGSEVCSDCWDSILDKDD